MPESRKLERDFFTQPTSQVARALLGARLVRMDGDRRLSGTIVETEAYRGEEDLGCHARAGLTPRTRVMYGPPGHAYIYFTYGMHWMLNFVTEETGFPAAVLIRAVIPIEGQEIIAARRANQPPHLWTNGPAKLCQAFGIQGELNGTDLCNAQAKIFVERGAPIPDSNVTIGPRVGLNNVPEPWKSIPWRYRVADAVFSHASEPGARR
jgi:DNA-3-methyladenine glycosylase